MSSLCLNRPIPEHHTTYQLKIRLKKSANITVGALGECYFPAGDYIYTGSAKNNIKARLRRHCSANKKLRWHIDYLLAHPHAQIVEITTSKQPECRLNQKTRGRIPVRKFGAGDCKNRCGSHLKAVDRDS